MKLVTSDLNDKIPQFPDSVVCKEKKTKQAFRVTRMQGTLWLLKDSLDSTGKVKREKQNIGVDMFREKFDIVKEKR